SSKEKALAAKNKKDEKDIRIQKLEKDILQAREDMRSITEEQEAANEELQSSNEELLSGSEELQSLNEELETSKEELQSTNEELITVNQELYDRNEELDLSRKFAETTISILHEPLLVLDKNFYIKIANRSFYKTFKLTEEETLEKKLFELQDHGWDIPGLRIELGKIQKQKEKMIEVEITFTFPVIGERIICFNIQPIQKGNDEQLILLALNDITLQKKAAHLLQEKAEDVLKEHQLLHSFLMESPALFAILKGPEHIFEFANTMYYEFTGHNDLIGKSVTEAMPELEQQGFLKLFDEVYKTGKPFIAKEMPVFLNTGNVNTEHTFLNFNYQSYNNEQGKTEGILVFAYDVTAMVLARKQLEQNAEMINDLYMNAPAFVCTLMGANHTYALINPSYQKLFGKRSIAGKPIMEALPELEGQGFDKILDNVYNTGEIFVGTEVPIMLARDEGLLPEQRYFNFSYQPIYDERKKITGILVFGYEVSEEIRGKKIQQESDARFRILADAMPQKMWTADANGNVNYFNDQWFDYTHKSFEELKDRGWEKIIHPDDWEHNKQTWLRSIETGEDFQLEHRFLNFEGTYRWHLSRGHSQKDASGNVLVWIGTHTDIHEQKLLAEELEKQVAKGIKLAHQKNDFISMASHELKTPVTSIKGYTQVLLNKFKDEGNVQAGAFLVKMENQINKLTSLISDLLDATKVTANQLHFHEGLFDFNELVKEIVDEMQQTTYSHTISMNLNATEMIIADRNRIGQVITNLLSNAIKYSPQANSVIVSSTYGNNHVTLSVQDFGIGIPIASLPNVFDQFFRAGGTLQNTFSGLGLGLFIASEIINRSKGTISVESEIGRGSIFSFTLPASNILQPLDAASLEAPKYSPLRN
ncbi:MAG: PAS domain-containing protein, partial [Panacibacter sp.]